MLTFSDDETYQPEAELSAGLRFHLSRCPSCRALAERLSAVGRSLGTLGDDRFDEEISERAVSRLRGVLLAGAKSTGRVTIEDEPADAPPIDGSQRVVQVSVTRRMLAVAACLGLTLGLFGMWSLIDRSPTRQQSRTLDSWSEPAHVGRRSRPTPRDWLGPDYDPQADLNVEAKEAEVDADDVIYVLAPDALPATHRRQGSGPPPRTVPPRSNDPSLTEPFLDKPASAVSTVNSTKDRQ